MEALELAEKILANRRAELTLAAQLPGQDLLRARAAKILRRIRHKPGALERLEARGYSYGIWFALSASDGQRVLVYKSRHSCLRNAELTAWREARSALAVLPTPETLADDLEPLLKSLDVTCTDPLTLAGTVDCIVCYGEELGPFALEVKPLGCVWKSAIYMAPTGDAPTAGAYGHPHIDGHVCMHNGNLQPLWTRGFVGTVLRTVLEGLKEYEPDNAYRSIEAILDGDDEGSSGVSCMCGCENIPIDDCYQTADGEYICSDHGRCCDRCDWGVWSDEGGAVWCKTRNGHDEGQWWCRRCADDHTYGCDLCGELIDERQERYELRDGSNVCPQCGVDYCTTCAECGALLHADEHTIPENAAFKNGDTTLCLSCFEEAAKEDMLDEVEQ